LRPTLPAAAAPVHSVFSHSFASRIHAPKVASLRSSPCCRPACCCCRGDDGAGGTHLSGEPCLPAPPLMRAPAHHAHPCPVSCRPTASRPPPLPSHTGRIAPAHTTVTAHTLPCPCCPPRRRRRSLPGVQPRAGCGRGPCLGAGSLRVHVPGPGGGVCGGGGGGARVVAVLASSVRGGVESGRGGVGPCCTRLPACLCGKRGLGRAQGAAAGATHALRSPQLPRLAPPSHPHTARRTACTMWWTAAATPSTPPRRTGGERRRGDACKQQRALLGAPLHSHCVGGSWPALLQFPGGGGGGGLAGTRLPVQPRRSCCQQPPCVAHPASHTHPLRCGGAAARRG
jgi:hypothetical protein